VRLLSSILISALLTGAVHAQSLECIGEQRQIADMWFGRKIGDRIAVTEQKWSRFVDREITPRFPDGLSVVDARGQWRDSKRNRIVREPSKLVTIVLTGNGGDGQRLQAIIDAYKSQFREQSVGLVVRPACVKF
jgi:Protein of unknown function (DUF3574)